MTPPFWNTTVQHRNSRQHPYQGIPHTLAALRNRLTQLHTNSQERPQLQGHFKRPNWALLLEAGSCPSSDNKHLPHTTEVKQTGKGPWLRPRLSLRSFRPGCHEPRLGPSSSSPQSLINACAAWWQSLWKVEWAAKAASNGNCPRHETCRSGEASGRTAAVLPHRTAAGRYMNPEETYN